MKIKYDPKADAMRITFNQRSYHHTKQVNDLVLIHFAEDETLVAIELLRVSWYTDDIETIIAEYSPQQTR
jgi:uncharacterized protein YuzE